MFRQLFVKLFGAKRLPAGNRQVRVRMCLETLENRWLPSGTYTWNWSMGDNS